MDLDSVMDNIKTTLERKDSKVNGKEGRWDHITSKKKQKKIGRLDDEDPFDTYMEGVSSRQLEWRPNSCSEFCAGEVADPMRSLYFWNLLTKRTQAVSKEPSSDSAPGMLTPLLQRVLHPANNPDNWITK